MPFATTSTAGAPTQEGSPEALEFWIAIAAGEPVWVDPDDDVTAIERLTAFIEILALAASLAITWTAILLDDADRTGFVAWAPWVATTSLLFMMVRPMRLVLSIRHQARLWPSFISRVALVTAAVASMIPLCPLSGALSLWPIAVALGVEAALCAWALGFEVEPLRWWTNFLQSPLHMGIVGGVVASVLYLGAKRTVTTVVPIYLVIHLCVLGSAAVARVLDRYRIDLEIQHEADLAAARAAEHRQSAHWLHDDVSAEIKLTELRLRDSDFGPSDVAQALAELDHQLRLRQLDELFRSGSVRLAEILQPFVRNAQSHGIEIVSVPTFDDASAMVDERLGRLFGRAVSITTTNAILAGARQLSFAIEADEQAITVAVTDDAGGFELSEIPAGRGLWQLGQELGTADITVEPCGRGSNVTIVLRRNLDNAQAKARSRHDATPPRR